MSMQEQQPVTTGKDLLMYGDRIVKNLKDAGMIVDKPLPTIPDFIDRLQELVRDVSEAYYSDSQSSRESIIELRKFVGMSDDW